MRTIPLSTDRLPEFIKYCRDFGREHDESYLPEPDFIPGPEDPAYLLVDDGNRPLGAVALMLGPFRKAGKARFRIFHAREGGIGAYGMLLDAIWPHADGVEFAYLFIPEEKQEMARILETLDFRIQRYSYVLRKPDCDTRPGPFPEGYRLEPLRWGRDEAGCSHIVNASFKHLAGHVDSTPEVIGRYRDLPEYLEDGLMLLWFQDELVGMVRVSRDMDDDYLAFIETLAVLPAYQGRGLGRLLLRAALQFGKEKGFREAALTVNAENGKAVELYLGEGFRQERAMVCYFRPVDRDNVKHAVHL